MGGITKFGNRRMQRAINKWQNDYLDDVKNLVYDVAYFLQSEARRLAAEDTGYLKESIEVIFFGNGFHAKVEVGASYAHFIEFGTGIYNQKGNGRKDGWVYFNERWGQFVFTMGMKAQPFYYPSIRETEKYFKGAVRKLNH